MSQPKFPTRRLGANGPFVSAVGYGAGSSTYTQGEEELETLTRAADLGITFWDSSDVYGSSEVTLGKWFSQTDRRSEIFLCTKTGAKDFTPGVTVQRFNSRPSHVRMQLEKSLQRLQTDYIDLYYQHRVDPDVPIEIFIETLRPYLEKGTIRYIGLSECSLDVLKRARAVPGIGEKVVAAQMEFSPVELGIETSGFLATAKELGVAVVGFSPFGRGIMSGKFKSPDDLPPSDLRRNYPRFSPENFHHNVNLMHKFQTVAERYNATSAQVTLAWILNRHPDMIPIPASRDIPHLEDNAASIKLTLKPEDVKELDEAVAAADVRGSRKAQGPAYTLNTDCIPLSDWKGE